MSYRRIYGSFARSIVSIASFRSLSRLSIADSSLRAGVRYIRKGTYEARRRSCSRLRDSVVSTVCCRAYLVVWR